MKQKTPDQIIIEHDIMRYKKNKWAQMLALLGLVFNCLYFMLVYAENDKYFYKITIGVSVILTLVTLLATFLSSENVKNYKKAYSYVLIVIAAYQIFRIFGYPLYGLRHRILTAGYFGFFPKPEQSAIIFVILAVYLVASAACLIGAAVIGLIQASSLEAYMKKVERGEVDVMATIRKMDEEDSANAVHVVNDPVIDEALKATEAEEEAEEEQVKESPAEQEEVPLSVTNEEVE